MIRVLICDDSPEARSVLRTMLSEQPEIEIVGEAANGGEAVAIATELEPDVVLMDVAMPVLDGVEATRVLRRTTPGVRIVAFAGSDEDGTVQEMLAAGAHAYCIKGAPLSELERAIAGADTPLVRLAHFLARSLTGGAVGQLVAHELAELTGAALVATYIAADDTLSLAGAVGPEGFERSGAVPGLAFEAFMRDAPIAADGHALAELYRLGVPSGKALAVPIASQGQAIGALLVAMPASVQVELDRKLVAAAADLAGAAFDASRQLALSFDEARRDALTGLPNRRAFDEHLDRVLAGPEEGITLLLLDLDDFKQVNDRDGHAAGDAVLRDISRVLLRTLRIDEEVFRLGGDEFAIVLRGEIDAGRRVFRRLRRSLLGHRRGRVLSTISAGVAAFPTQATSRDELVELADAALYEAKRTGKDRIIAAVGAEPVATRKAPPRSQAAGAPEATATETAAGDRGLRVLVVDDDEGLRALLRTTFEVIDIVVEEAAGAAEAEERISVRAPDIVVLDIAMPGIDGLSFCRQLKGDARTSTIPIVLLSGAATGTEAAARDAGADALLRKPFSPLDLLATVEQLAGRLYEGPFRLTTEERPEEQILFYAQDLRRLLEIEQGQRLLLQDAYRETVGALAAALESKDFGTGAHSQRVKRYAVELTSALVPELRNDPSLEYGFLLHDIGKIAIPDQVLQKAGPLTSAERRLMQTHTVLGEQLLASVNLLQGEGLKVIRSHHERWDGLGYPDGLAGEEISLGGRIFAVADALDALTSDRPYRRAGTWEHALTEIAREKGRQFDPTVVDALLDCAPRLRRIYWEMTVEPASGATAGNGVTS